MIHICDKLPALYLNCLVTLFYPQCFFFTLFLTKAKINGSFWKDTPSIESLLVSREKCFFRRRQLRATEGNMLPVSQIFSMPTKYFRFSRRLD